MELNNYVFLGYGIFLLIMLGINILYFFQVFKYRLPGDASITILIFHLVLMFSVLTLGSLLVLG